MESEGRRGSREAFADQVNAVFETDAAGALPANDLDPYAFRILTVCTGNICRSPLAEALLRRALRRPSDVAAPPEGFFEVSSAGTGALVGEPADGRIALIADRMGADLSHHLARQLEPAHAENAHLIVTATREHRDAVSALAPTASARTFTLLELFRVLDQLADSGELSASAAMHRPARMSRHLQRVIARADETRRTHRRAPAHGRADRDDIDDPYRRSDETYVRVAQQVEGVCAAVGARLRSALA